jgi:hypothetical protein
MYIKSKIVFFYLVFGAVVVEKWLLVKTLLVKERREAKPSQKTTKTI